MRLWLQNTDIAGIGDAEGIRGSVVAGSLYFSLHTADVGEAGDQLTNEVAYTPYARISVARSGVGFSVVGSTGSPVANIDFPQRTDVGTVVATHWALGVNPSGAGKVLYKGGIGPPMVCFTAKDAGDVFTIPDLTFVVDERVQFLALEGGSLPGGVTEGVAYFVKTVSGKDITVSTTLGGDTLPVTSDGAGFAQKIEKITIEKNTIPRFTTATIIREG